METLKLETELQRELSCMCLRSIGSVDISVPSSSHKNQVQEFFLLMAICNTLVVSLHAHEDPDGMSPEECEKYAVLLFECKHSLLDMRQRFRGRKGDRDKEKPLEE